MRQDLSKRDFGNRLPESEAHQEEMIRLAGQLLSSSAFRFIPMLLQDMETEAISEIRANRGSPQDNILTIQIVDRLRNSIRAIATQTGAPFDRTDPFDGYA